MERYLKEPILEYQSHSTVETAEPLWHLQRTALWCGGIPLTVGLTTFFAWLCTKSLLLELVGFLVLLVGTILVLLGLWCLLAFASHEKRQVQISGRAAAKVGWWPLIVLLANFPAAVGVLAAVEWVNETYTLYVKNTTSSVVDQMIMTSDAGALNIGSIQPGQTRAIRVHGELNTTRWTYRSVSDGKTHSGGEWFNRSEGGGPDVQIDITPLDITPPMIKTNGL
jgi:hypothetical protein